VGGQGSCNHELVTTDYRPLSPPGLRRPTPDSASSSSANSATKQGATHALSCGWVTD